MAASSYSIVPSTREDIPAMVACFFAAFASDPIVGQIEAKCDPEAKTKQMERWMARQMDMADQGLLGTRLFKAVDENGTLAGFGKWVYPITLTASQQEQKSAIEAKLKEAHVDLPGTNFSLQKDFFGQLNTNRKKHMDPSKDYFMHILSVSPEHHRKGLGSKLLAHVLAICDREGARCYIEASAVGLPLYVRHGWVSVDETAVDLGKHGLEGGVIVQQCLMREPQRDLV